MTIIKIEPNELGGHENNTIYAGDIQVPEGWAIVPEGMEIPESYPFVHIEVDETQTPPVVAGMTPGTVPPPAPEPEPEPSETEILRADVDYLSMMTGIDLPN